MYNSEELGEFIQATHDLAVDLSHAPSSECWGMGRFAIEVRPPSIASGAGQLTHALMFQVDIEAPAAYPMQIVKEACLTPPYGDARAWVHHNTLTTAVCVALEFSEAWGVLAQHRDRKVFKLIQETAQIVEAIGLECMPEILQLDHMLGTEIALVWPREGLPGLRTNAARGPMAGAK